MYYYFIATLFLCAWILLSVYLVYTVIAIFSGAAPVPLPHAEVARMVALAELYPGTHLIDIGSGDGRILIAAAKQGAECTGFEINPLLCWYSRLRAWCGGLTKVTVVRGDFWKHHLGPYQVLTVFLIPHQMERLREKITLEMQPGSIVLVARYPIPGWAPVQQQGWIYQYRTPTPLSVPHSPPHQPPLA